MRCCAAVSRPKGASREKALHANRIPPCHTHTHTQTHTDTHTSSIEPRSTRTASPPAHNTHMCVHARMRACVHAGSLRWAEALPIRVLSETRRGGPHAAAGARAGQAAAGADETEGHWASRARLFILSETQPPPFFFFLNGPKRCCFFWVGPGPRRRCSRRGSASQTSTKLADYSTIA